MDNEELKHHLQYVDGVMLAQSLILKALLRQQPLAAAQLRDYITHLKTQKEYEDMSQAKREAMESTFENFLGLA
jgi:hypothetical protein